MIFFNLFIKYFSAYYVSECRGRYYVWLLFVEVGHIYVLYIQAYLSLPKGFASAAGLIAMMTDHYSNLVRLVRFL